MPLAQTRPLKCLRPGMSATIEETSSLAFSLPAEIILEIADNLVCPRDILNFGLQSRRLLPLLLPLLYASLTLQSNKAIRKILKLFTNRPELARHLRELTIRPNYTKEVPCLAGGYLDEILVARVVERLAVEGNLKGLQLFFWQGLEGPTDRLWLTLRLSCPSLNRIGSSINIGLSSINPNSHLYKFSDLISFSLIIKWRNSQPGHVREEHLPTTLWKMLISRCPDLQHLTMGGPSMTARTFAIRPLAAARWPGLRSLTLGNVDLYPMRADDTLPFYSFLQAHPTLESLSLHTVRSFMPPNLRLPYTALPRLTFLSGVLYHVHDLPNPAKLTTLCLTSIRYMPSFLRDILRRLTSLTSLSTCIDLPYFDHHTFFHFILDTCPGLLFLEILCSTHTSFTFSYQELSSVLRMYPSHLQTLSITKVPHSSDSKQLIKTASILAVKHPNLRNITLRHAYEQWWSVPGKMPRLREAGTFVVVKDMDGVPVALEVDEWRVGWFGRKVVRRYEYLPIFASAFPPFNNVF